MQHHHSMLHGPGQEQGSAATAAALMSNFLPSAMGFGGSGALPAQLQQLNRSQELAAAAAYAVPCHMNMTTPFYAAAAAAANAAQASRQHQMPAALSIFPTYQGEFVLLYIVGSERVFSSATRRLPT